MKTISQSFIFAGIVLALLAGVFTFSTITVDAQTTCGSCDDPSTPTTPGGGGGGGSTPNPPSCNISVNIDKVFAGNDYVISWVGTPNAVYRMNNALVNPTGSYTYTMESKNEYERFVIYGKNGDGECADEVKVHQKFNSPVCDISTDISIAVVGDAYTVTWAGTPAEASFKINGSNVPDSGSKGFTFTGPNKDEFTMTGDLYGETCSDTAKVVKKTVEVPTPSCDLFTANPTTIPRGGTAMLAWESTNASAAAINNAIGSVSVDGTIDVSPLNDTTYVLTLTAPGQDPVTCNAPVYVSDVTECKLEVTKSVDKYTATPGAQLTYTVKVKNVGTADCTGGGVKIEDVLDANFTYQSNTYTSNLSEGYGSKPVYTASDRTIRFNGHVLTPGESGTIVLFGKIATPNTCGDYVVKNQARATAKELNNFNTWVYSEIVKTDVDYDCDVPVPVCESFTAEPDTLPYGGGSSILDWDLLNVATASIDNGIGDVTIGSPAVNKTMSGSRSVSVTETTTFTLTAVNVAGQTVSCDTTIVVEDLVPAPKCVAFTGTKAIITVGESLFLNWDTLNATQIVIDNAVGDVTDITAKTFEVSPIADTIYNLTVIGEAGTTPDTSCTVPVKVNPVVIDDVPAISIIKRDNADKDDTQEVTVGGTATFEIVVTNTGDENLVNVIVSDPIEPSCVNAIGDLAIGASNTYTCTTTNVAAAFTNTAFVTGDSAVDGEVVTDNDPTNVTIKTVVEKAAECKSFAATPSALGVGGGDVVLNWEVLNATSVSIDNGVGTVGLTGPSSAINVTASKTFTLTAIGEDGVSVDCPAPVAVANPGVFTCEGNVSFSASDSSITRGQSSTLNWDVTDADSVSISGISATTFAGSQLVSPSSDTTYTLSATKSGFEPISCPVVINVSTGGGGGGSSSPRCELEISAERIDAGDEIELTWDSSRARELTLTDNFGNVLVTTEDKLSGDKDDLFEGSLRLNPTRNTTYTLLVERGSRDRECEVDVEMDDETVLLQVRDQAPLVSGISLTQVPYTGFEAGPVMTVLFYMLLIAWALYITYVLVMPKAQLAMVPVQNSGVKSNEDLMRHAEQIRPDVFATISAAPVVAAPANLPVVHTAQVAVPVVTEIPDTNSIENQAHALQALVSSDAARTIAAMTTEENQAEVVAKIVSDAKGMFALEDGWVVLNQSRLAQITDTAAVTVSPSPTGAGSLAEAIVTGNVVAAYDLVGNRPMIALADAAADLDAVYRIKKGADATVSDMLAQETTNLSDEQVAGMIAALTGALDGTYSDESSAVKMAIMKAVKIAA